MARRLEGTVEVTAVPRPWLAGFVRAVYDQRRPPPEITVTSWGPARIEGVIIDELDRIEFAFESVDDPRTVTANGRQGDIVRWDGAARLADGRVGIDARFEHPKGDVHVEIHVEDMAAPRWRVTLTVDIDARGWGRILVALTWGSFQRKFAKELRAMAREWDEAIDPLVARPPEEAVRW